jgi:hypothetical protein
MEPEEISVTEPAAEPAAAGPSPAASDEPSEPGYRLVELHLDLDGGVRAQERQHLTAKVYSRGTALRLAAYLAKKVEKGSSVFVVVGPTGRGIAVLAGGSGRPVSPAVALRAKRKVAELMPAVGLFRQREQKRRGSRPVRRRGRRSR